jgi:hypothetical protein
MVAKLLDRKAGKSNRATRIIYSTLALSVISGAVTVLGAPMKF